MSELADRRVRTFSLGTSRPADVLGRTFKAEWTKFRTLRARWVTFGISAAASVALAALICFSNVSHWDSMGAKQQALFDGTSNSLSGVLFGAIIIGSLAVRAITSECSSGMIRLTFSAVPRRRSVLASKAASRAAVAFPVAQVSNVVAFFVGQQIPSAKHVDTAIGAPGVLTAIVFWARGRLPLGPGVLTESLPQRVDAGLEGLD